MVPSEILIYGSVMKEQLEQIQWLAARGRVANEREAKRQLANKVTKIDLLIEDAARRGEDNLNWDGIVCSPSGKIKIYPKYKLLEDVREHYGRLGFDTSVYNSGFTHPHVVIDWYHRQPKDVHEQC